jgi:hypothetical protein
MYGGCPPSRNLVPLSGPGLFPPGPGGPVPPGRGGARADGERYGAAQPVTIRVSTVPSQAVARTVITISV